MLLSEIPNLPSLLKGPFSPAAPGVVMLHTPKCPQARQEEMPDSEVRILPHAACLDVSLVAELLSLMDGLCRYWSSLESRVRIGPQEEQNFLALSALRLQNDPAWGGSFELENIMGSLTTSPYRSILEESGKAVNDAFAAQMFKEPVFKTAPLEGSEVVLAPLWSLSYSVPLALDGVPDKIVNISSDPSQQSPQLSSGVLNRLFAAPVDVLLRVSPSRRAQFDSALGDSGVHTFYRSGKFLPVMFEESFMEWWPFVMELLNNDPLMTVDAAVSSAQILAESN